MATTTLVYFLRRNASRFGGRAAIEEFRDGRWEVISWAQFEAMVDAARHRAARLPGPALLALDNSARSLAALLGLTSGGVALAVAEADSAQLADPQSVFHTTAARHLVTPGDRSPAAGYEVVLAADLTKPDVTASGVDDGDPVVLQSTSGSTGEPRLAIQTLANLLEGARLYERIYSVTPADRILAAVPAAHSFGMVAGLLTAVVSGAKLMTFTGFSPRGAREAIEGGATVMLGTPLVYELLNRTMRASRGRLRVALSSGGPLPAHVAGEAGERLGTTVLQAYGSTETGLIACQYPRTEPWPEGCVGAPASGVSFEVSPDGELTVRTGTMFRGYHGHAPLDASRGYRTGDIAELDPDGHLSLVRRKDTFINVGGRKVNPARVARIIGEYPHVAESAVYGREALGGQEVAAAVVLTGGDVPALLAHCRAHLAAYEVPHRIHVLDRLPRNGMGKIDRSRLPQ
ncbi:class I adenylate-forming enzyme family protein [Actinocrispum sp. NPDC049592]|uniref:class I adenylate-forming enzyme family protein n=1 Tax=Actinocrispum sp. NPDC049592 TaxID=3154835 RepID=UPI00341253B2